MCKIEGCERPVKARLMCSLHYKRWQRTGNPSIKTVPNFKGDNARYLAIHVRLRNTYGNPAKHLCIDCLGQASEWAYLHTGETKYDFVGNYKVPYSTNLDDYGPMCRPCHSTMDSGASSLIGKTPDF